MPALGLPHFLGSFRRKLTNWCDFRHTHVWWLREGHKVPQSYADTTTMIISEEQALLAARYLSTSHPSAPVLEAAVSADVLAAARAVAEETPETREDRVSEAREHMGAGVFHPYEVASKMISRIISDSLR